jgi:hypothetical protein
MHPITPRSSRAVSARGRCHRSPVPSPTGQRSRRPNRRSGSVAGSGPRDNAQVPSRLPVPNGRTGSAPSRALHNDDLRSMVEGRTAGEDALPVVDRTRTWSAIWTGANRRTGPARPHESAPGEVPQNDARNKPPRTPQNAGRRSPATRHARPRASLSVLVGGHRDLPARGHQRARRRPTWVPAIGQLAT